MRFGCCFFGLLLHARTSQTAAWADMTRPYPHTQSPAAALNAERGGQTHARASESNVSRWRHGAMPVTVALRVRGIPASAPGAVTATVTV